MSLERNSRRATFLPQVWEALADPRAFVCALKRKAGLPENFWNPQVNISRYTVARWAERGTHRKVSLASEPIQPPIVPLSSFCPH